jgi:HD-like signal output (HDOD) protein
MAGTTKMSTVWEQVTAKAKLVSLPEVYFQLKNLLDLPEYSLKDVAAVVEQDPALTARLLRLVNSAFFGLAVRVDTVHRAINMLGAWQVHDLALATSVAQTFEDMSNEVMDMRSYWQDSVLCALSARLLAEKCNVLDSDRLFVAGLLRDIGHLVMYQSVPQLAQQALTLAADSGRPIFLVERETIGLDYARVGAVLMRQWRLPDSLREATEFHVEPGRAMAFPLEAFLVHIADLLARSVGTGEDFSLQVGRIHPESWDVTGLTLEQCLSAGSEAKRRLESVMNLLFPVRRQVGV